ncbi:MAG TPA: amino acid adenylation domain-containing protein [Pilimelia sp.]|nr:amino acid adenylation domain-containing protein [Pilimelia sp.]
MKSIDASPGTRERVYETFTLQEGLLFNHRYEPGAGVDVIQIVCGWPEPLDRAAMARAWQHAAARHAVLRTAFTYPAEGALQQVEPAVAVPVAHVDSESHGGPGDPLEAYLRQDRARDFDPQTAPLVRVALVHRGAGRHAMVLTFHHAILDGRSVRLLLAEVTAEYETLRRGNEFTAPQRRPYRDFVDWSRRRSTDADRRFWTAELRGATGPTQLPLVPAVAVPPRRPDSVREIGMALPEADTEAAHGTARAAGVSVSTLVTAAWAVLLHHYSGAPEVVFGTTRTCHMDTVDGADQMIGMLLNTLPLRVPIAGDRPVSAWLGEVRDRVRAVCRHRLTPLRAIHEWSGLPAETPLFDSLVVFEHRDMQSALAATDPAWAGRTVRVHRHPAQPLTVCAFGGPRLQILLYHDRRRLGDALADRMLRHLRTVLLAMIHRPETPVAELPRFDTAERAELLGSWQGARTPYPADATVPELFAAQVARTPQAPAVTFGDTVLSYAELDARANQLAHLLAARGVAADTPVGVALPRSIDLVVALLAILKAGGAYLPLDPANPPAHTARLLAASGARLTVACAETAAALPTGAATVRLDTLGAELAGQPAAPPPARIPATGLAYVSYTSGSTGVPKGVGVPHRAISRLVHDPGYVTLGPGERLLQLAPVAFDASTLELWGALLTGATLVVAPPGPLGLPELAALIQQHRITTLWLTAGLFHQLAEYDVRCLAGVRQLLAGGDVLAPGAVRAALTARGGQPLVNGYGPTENTTFTTCHVLRDPAEVGDPVPIGRPVPRTTVYVLDARRRPVPVGVPGELYTGGDGLARGYLGQPGRTAGRFLPDPFAGIPGARMYRTGDRVRWLPDGTLEFLGRIDSQVKVRGFRVEPGEVEAVLRQHPAVRDAAVVVDGRGEHRRLLAYLTGAPGTPDVAAVREHTEAQLPAYLRPAGYAVLAKLPLTANGKVDRRALPSVPAVTGAANGAPPRDPTQIALAGLWRRLLRVDAVAARDDFFSLGGNSLLATRLTFEVAEAFGVRLPIRAVYDRRTLAGLAAEIDAGRAPGNPDPAGQAGGLVRRDRSAYRLANGSGGLARHLVRPSPGPWAAWRWVGLRSAGFPIAPLTALGDLDLVAAADALTAADDAVVSARQALSEALQAARRAAPAAERASWNRAVRHVAQGRLPELEPAAAHPALAAVVDRFAAAGAERSAAAERFAAAADRAARARRAALREVARDPAFREAVTWQNPHALRTAVDPVAQHDPADPGGSQHRQHEALVANYLQRYCAKNDTIGFFGPVGWARITTTAPPLTIHDGPALASRTVYFENWAIADLAEAIAVREPGLRPWLVPRRLPFVGVAGDSLLLPLSPPTLLEPDHARLLRECDGVRTAGEIAAALVADPATGFGGTEDVFAVLAKLRNDRRITWSLEVPKEDLRPELALRARLVAIPDEVVRDRALAALDTLVDRRDAAADAAGDPDRLAEALADLAADFTRLTGRDATRRAGSAYAARTLVYEDCRAGREVTLSEPLLATLWPVLGVVLDSARWFTFAGATLFRRACQDRYRELVARSGTAEVPFADFWLWSHDLLFDLPEKFIAPVVRGLHDRWAGIISAASGTPVAGAPGAAGAGGGVRRIDLRLADIRDAAARAFAAPRPGWTGAWQHSPDVLLAATGPDAIARGDYRWVVGEVHPGVNTLRSALFVAQHPRPAELAAAMTADLPGPRVVLAATGEEGGAPARLTDKLVTPRDQRLTFGHDTCGLDPATAIAVADCVLVEQDGALVVRSRGSRMGAARAAGGAMAMPLSEVVGEALMLQLLQRFDILRPAAHQPRVTVDRVVLSRETWRVRACDLEFARITNEAIRFRRVRQWQRALGIPRFAFVKTPVERKPFYVDFASLAAVDGLARAVRRTVAGAGPDAVLRISEMLPRPDQLWLTDDAGARRAAEFRLVAVDTRRTGAGGHRGAEPAARAGETAGETAGAVPVPGGVR